jgi:DNA polymerase-3 subunit gamma/tau
MLKTLEEPPEHVKFILATTDPQKIPVTVLSRCLQFNLKQMPAVAITGHLATSSRPKACPSICLRYP